MKPLLALIFVISLSANAEDNYVEFGVTNVGSWNSIPSTGKDFNGQKYPDIVDSSNRDRKFVSFHKELNDNFYLLGSHTETKTIPPSVYSGLTTPLREKVSTLGIGYSRLLKGYEPYVELSTYRYTKSYNTLIHGWILGSSEIISIGSDLKRHGSMYRLGLRKKLVSNVDIDISYGSYQNITLDNSKHRNKSIKLIRDFNDRLSLVFNYEKDGDGKLFKRVSRSLSLRTKF